MAVAELSSTIVDDRAGFYMVPSASIAKARARLTGAHLTEALAGLACLARESFAQNGASRDEQQTLEANLDELSRRILGVSRARALRILDHLVDAGALTKEAHRFDGTRRLPTKVTFVDLAYSFAYVSGPAFRALRADSDNGGAPFGALALYLTFVALGGEQRDEFPDGNRRIARASQPELAKLSGLSVSSVKRAVNALVSAGLLTERAQPHNALKTKAVYHLVDPVATAGAAPGNAADRSPRDRATVHSNTDDGSQQNRRTAPNATVDGPQPDRSSAHGLTDVGSEGDRPTPHSETDRRPAEPARAHVKMGQRTAHLTDEQIPLSADDDAAPTAGGEGSLSEADQLIEIYRCWTRDVLGQRRADAVYDAENWRRAADQLLEQYDLDRLLSGVDRLRRDSLLADKATTLPAFALVAERAIARAAADRALADHRSTAPSNAATRATGPSWTSAQALLRKAVSAFGSAGEDRALAYLAEYDPHLAAFATRIGWRALARSSDEMTDVKFAYLEFCRHDRTEAA